ncbi:MAG: carboxypeptidase-like regulatory domain-containing protein [Acidimicrobiia bacterium]|nr:carboxypeptidase-like regulatory domain-containing protein [Acidimicrobiia bacterium]
MDVLKPALFALMASVLAVMWFNRHDVVNAYTEDQAPPEIRLSGVALDFEKSEIPASPYVVHLGQDTRRRPMSLLFTDSEEAVEIGMTGGTTRIEGTVTVDGLPAAGGIVRLERHTSSGVGVRDLAINAKGWFAGRDLPGGRYRVRAWLTGTATMTSSDVFFAAAESTTRRNYVLERIESSPLIEFANGGTMYVGMTGSFGASVTQREVNGIGLVVTRPVAGFTVSARFTDYVDVLSPESQATNDKGLVVFNLRCRRAGQGSVMVAFGERVIPVDLPPCVPVPPTTPTTAPTSEPNDSSGRRPAAGSGSTATTAPDSTSSGSSTGRPGGQGGGRNGGGDG